jgi:hypothetical protein
MSARSKTLLQYEDSRFLVHPLDPCQDIDGLRVTLLYFLQYHFELFGNLLASVQYVLGKLYRTRRGSKSFRFQKH